MKAMIFAAGEGRRMRPLTLATPKPLLRVGGHSLLEHQLQKMIVAGVHDFVINASYLAEQIIKALSAMQLGEADVQVSIEDTPLETGGGIYRALPFLGGEPFLLVNSDVWTHYDFAALLSRPLSDSCLAHLVLVANPDHNAMGDFELTADGLVQEKREPSTIGFTFSGISIIKPALISQYSGLREVFPLREALLEAMASGRVTGEYYGGFWSDVGTPERLNEVRELEARA